MAHVRTFIQSFGGGEVSPEMVARLGDARREQGASRMHNMIATPTGPTRRRPGTKFVREVKDSTKRTRLIPFQFSRTETIAIEVGESYFRFHSNGGTLTPPPYFVSETFTVATGTDFLTLSSGLPLKLSKEEKVWVTSTTTLPGGLSASTDYYVETRETWPPVFGAVIRLHSSLPIVPAMHEDITSTGTGTHTIHRRYEIGDIVESGGSIYECTTAHINSPPPSANWNAIAASTVYEVANSFDEDDLFGIRYAQSFDVLTLTHKLHLANELRRIADLSWTFGFFAPWNQDGPTLGSASRAFGTSLQAACTAASPTVITTVSTDHGLSVGQTVYAELSLGDSNTWGGTAAAGFYYIRTKPAANQVTLRALTGADVGAGSATNVFLRPADIVVDDMNVYVATYVFDDGYESFETTTPVSFTNNLFALGSYNRFTISTPASGINGKPIASVRIYRKSATSNGIFAFVQEIKVTGTSVTFTDDRLPPDFNATPPQKDLVLSTGQPAAVCFFEGRRFFGGGSNSQIAAPQDVYSSRTNVFDDISYHIPTVDDDRIYFRVASRQYDEIMHLVPLSQLLILTTSTEFRVAPIDSDALTPDSVAVRPQSYIGANDVQPIVVNNNAIFASARGGHLREIGYRNESAGYVTGDLSLRAAHLFDGYDIVDMALMKARYPVVWCVSSSGQLLGLTYVPEEGIGAWHEHDVGGGFVESCCVVSEGDEDILYLIVKRTINGSEVRYVERLDEMAPFTEIEDGYFLDCGLSYTNSGSSAVTTISGLDHLEAEVVDVLNDGAVEKSKTVIGGQITLSTPLAAGATAHIGLPMTSELVTLPLAMQIEGLGQGYAKTVRRAHVEVVDSARFKIGPSDSVSALRSSNEIPVGVLRTGQVDVAVMPKWGDGGKLAIRQEDPVPLSVAAMTLRVEVGN